MSATMMQRVRAWEQYRADVQAAGERYRAALARIDAPELPASVLLDGLQQMADTKARVAATLRARAAEAHEAQTRG